MSLPSRRRSAPFAAALLAALVIAAGCGDENPPTGPSELFVVGPSGNFRSIADALTTAQENEVIRVQPGTYAERVVVRTPGIKLRADRGAILDGQGAGLDGRGVGILVAGVSGVEISGFTVQNFERGIVLERASRCTVTGNEVRNNTNKAATTSPPLAPGADPYEGIVLITSNSNEITENFVHGNGHDGLMLAEGSSSNVVRRNRLVNNGGQTTPGLFG